MVMQTSPEAFNLVPSLKVRAGSMISQANVPDQDIAEIIQLKALSLFPAESLSSLSDNKKAVVLIGAHASLCYRVASDGVHFFEYESQDHDGKPQQVVTNSIRLAKVLDDEVKQLMEDNGYSNKFKVTCHEVTRKDIFNGTVPRNAQIETPLAVSGLSVTANSEGLSISWEMSKDSDFTAYHVIYKEDSDIVNDSYYGVINKVHKDAKRARVVVNRHQTGIQMENLSPGTYYFVVAIETGTGVYSFSSPVAGVMS